MSSLAVTISPSVTQRAIPAKSDGPSTTTDTASATTHTHDLSMTSPRTFKDHQSNVLPHKKLMVVFPVIALAQMISYLDQTSVSTALPAIGASLNLGPSISWVAASFLIASTSIQLINGRLSDIFGRKPLLITALGLLALGNLLSGFSTSPAMLFAFRAMSGLGGGAINALVMVISSDITSLKQRGKYNGFIGAMVALGNGLGPLIGGLITQKASWNWVFWFIVPIILGVMILLAFVLPRSNVTGDMWTKIRFIDWAGLTTNIAAVLLLLVPISEGGARFAWDSALVIAMLTVGVALVLLFVVIEWRLASLPIMPQRLFTNDLSANVVLVQGTIHGFVYWANLFYVPIFLQNVHGYGPVVSGAIIIPMVASHGIGSIISGQLISRTGHYNPIIRSAGLIALLAHSRKADRAVINSLRNFLRAVGGAVGLTVSGSILNNILKKRLTGSLSSDAITQLTSSVYALPSLRLSPQQYNLVLDAYMSGIHTIFTMYAPLIGVCFLSSWLVTDRGVAEKDATVAERSEAGGDIPLAVLEEGANRSPEHTDLVVLAKM
ncbi:MAG: hypothetical protein Q9187_002957 [Circinaria calcarea]